MLRWLFEKYFELRLWWRQLWCEHDTDTYVFRQDGLPVISYELCRLCMKEINVTTDNTIPDNADLEAIEDIDEEQLENRNSERPAS